MRRLLLVVLCLLYTSVVLAQGTVTYRSFFSPHLNETRAIGVYLPEGYDPGGTTRYPVIYFLHGWGGSHVSYWYVLKPVLDDMIDTGQIQPCIVVTPNGWVAPYDGSLWTNSALYGAFDDYVAYDVVAFVDASYPTLTAPRTRAVMGHSMGAIGCMTTCLLHPDVFGAVAAHSGYFNWDRIREDMRDAVLAENPGPPYHFQYGGATYTSAVFMIAGGYSPNLQNPPTYVDYPFDEQGAVVEPVISLWMTHNPDVLAAALRPGYYPDIYFDCGDQDDFFMYPTNFDLAAAFDSMGVPYQFRPFQGGHDLTPDRLRYSFTFLDQVMNDPAALGDRVALTQPVLRLDPSRPSPVVGSSEIRFRTATIGRTTLRIIDAQGRVLETLLDGLLPSGEHTLQWRPGRIPSGLYFCELSAGDLRTTRKLVVSP
jgi:enterochelin esterase-like enzyme